MIQTCFGGRYNGRMRIVPAFVSDCVTKALSYFIFSQIFLVVLLGLHQKGTGNATVQLCCTSLNQL